MALVGSPLLSASFCASTTGGIQKLTKIDNIHKIHAPKIQGVFFPEAAEVPQAITTSRTVLVDPETSKKCQILVGTSSSFQTY